MPEEKQEITSQEEASTKDGSAPDTDNAEGSIFENMTPEELRAALAEKDKSYKELHSKVGQMSGELGELRTLRERVENDNKLATVLETAQQLASKKDDEPKFDYEEWENKIVEKAAENPGEALKEALRTMGSWDKQVEQGIESKYQGVIDELRSQVSSLAEVVETTTPDYQQNKELIEKFKKEYGMDTKKAKALAKEVRDMVPESQRAEPPVGVTPSRVVPPQKKEEKPWTDDDVQRWQAEGRSEQFIDMMKAKRERDAQLTPEDRENF